MIGGRVRGEVRRGEYPFTSREVMYNITDIKYHITCARVLTHVSIDPGL